MELESSSATLVTCYYKIKSKHTFCEYATWIKNLLLSIRCNIIIFTSADQADILLSLANTNRNTLETQTQTQPGKVRVIIKELLDLDIVKTYPNIWEEQHMKDPTPHIRTKECYMIWNSKLSLVKEAIALNPFNSDKFIWNDIGSLRDIRFILNNYKNLFHYPRYELISKDKIDIVLIKDYTNPEQYIFQDEIHLSGAIFGGGQDALLKLIEIFYKNFKMYLEEGYFIGCDQQILSTCLHQQPELFNLIIPDFTDNIIDKWFYLYHHYTQDTQDTQDTQKN